MRKNILFLVLICMVVVHSAIGATVTATDAQTVAKNFFRIHVPGAPASINPSVVYTRTEPGGVVDFYVFNAAPATGFIIVAADDVIEPVIGYSSESNFDLNAMNKTGLKNWMGTASAKISGAVQHQVAAGTQISHQWTSYRLGLNPNSGRTGSVAPLMATTWNQEPNYNALCPFNSTDNQRCVTGCVATAMAQIMKFWNYPTTGNGSYSYNNATSAGFSYNYGTQSANFGATTYAWSSMPNTISAANSSIATLMYHCGVAVAMDYGDDNQGGSGAAVLQSDAGTGNPCAQQAYATYFRYNAATLQGVRYSSYTNASWIALMETELNAGRPIQYAGFDTAGRGGHTWVCDGYNTSNQLHMNWGWGGYNNGYFSVTSLNAGGYNFSSGEEALIGIQPLTTTTTCGVPVGLASSAITTSGATVSWTAVSGATSYNLQYKTSPATTWTTVSVTTNTKALTGLTAGTTYNYQVAAVCASGTSAYSTASSFTTLTACGVPVSLASSAISTSGATVSWTAVSGATSYNLQYKTSAATTWTTVTVTTNSKALTGLTAGTTYNYQVAAVCASGTSAYSTASSFTTLTACGVPVGLASSAITTSSATVNWTAVSGATSYSLQYKTAAATTWTTVTVTTNSKALTALTAGTTYNYKVSATCASGTSAYSIASSFTTLTACGVASGLASSAITSSGATVSWTAVSGATSYNLQYKTSAATTWTTVSVTTNSKALTGLTAGTTYNYQVAAICASGTSAYSTASSFTTLTACGVTPRLAVSAITTTGATVTWLAVTGAISYNLQYKASTATVWTTVSVTGTSRVLTGLTPGTTYNYQVATVCASGTSAYCVTYSFTTIATVAAGGQTDTIERITDISEASADKGNEVIRIYPVPAQNSITIRSYSDASVNATINIYDLTGKRLLSQEHQSTIGENDNVINISTLPIGIYVAEMVNNGKVRRTKFSILR